MYGSTPGTGSQTAPGASSETDRTLVSQVRTELNKDASLAAIVPTIQITAQNGTVTLSGNVPSEQEKQKIEAAVKNAGNVVTVDNQLQVSSSSSTTSGQSSANYPVGQTRSLSPTSDQAKSRVYAPNQTDASAPATSTSQADRFVQNIKGMTEADKTLAQRIGQHLKADTSMASAMSKVKIEVNDGKATLKGNVSAEDQKQKIEEAIEKVPGVTSVDNQLQVSGSSQSESKTQQ